MLGAVLGKTTLAVAWRMNWQGSDGRRGGHSSIRRLVNLYLVRLCSGHFAGEQDRPAPALKQLIP